MKHELVRYIQFFSDKTLAISKSTAFVAYSLHMVLHKRVTRFQSWRIENGDTEVGFLLMTKEEEGSE